VSITTGGETIVDEAPVQVISVGATELGGDDGNNSPGDAVVLDAGSIYVGHTGTIGDVDYYRIPAPADPGTRIQVFISNPANDNDLFAYVPVTDELSDQPATISIGTQPFLDEPQKLGGSGVAFGQPEQIPDQDALTGVEISDYSTARATATDEVEVISKTSTAGEDFLIQVVSANGEASNAPYAIRVKTSDPIPPPSCPTSPRHNVFKGGAPTGYVASEYTNSPISFTANVVFLANAMRLFQAYGAAEAQAMIDTLVGVGANPGLLGSLPAGLVGEVLWLDAVNYSAWDADPCSIDAVNAIGSSIIDLMQANGVFVDDEVPVEHVNIIGGDDQVPFFRTPDSTRVANQATYADQFPQDSALYAAYITKHVLSDNPFCTRVPIGNWLNRNRYVPDMACGRVVETASEIQTTLQNFIDFEGQLGCQRPRDRVREPVRSDHWSCGQHVDRLQHQ
jgi:hypothetical protein